MAVRFGFHQAWCFVDLSIEIRFCLNLKLYPQTNLLFVVLKSSIEVVSNFSYKGTREPLKYFVVDARSNLGKSFLQPVSSVRFRPTQYQRRRLNSSYVGYL